MSVSWGVLPIVPEIHGWLSENGLATDIQKTRYPTLDELMTVLESFDLPIQKELLQDNTSDGAEVRTTAPRARTGTPRRTAPVDHSRICAYTFS